MKVELHTNYTLQQLLALRTESNMSFGSAPRAAVMPKKKITRYSDFDQTHRQAYQAIYDAIALANPGVPFTLFAYGSRVAGRWRTDEEAEGIAQPGLPVKYSDWDVISSAPNRPTDAHLAAVGLAGLRLDCLSSASAAPRPNSIPIEPSIRRRVGRLVSRLVTKLWKSAP